MLHSFIREMPKVELHVHLEGSIRPKTLLKLAEKNNVPIPVSTIDDIEKWYSFTDFDHFIDIYRIIGECLQTLEDFELISRDFLKNQAQQNIQYSEVTFTPLDHRHKVSLDDQLKAINKARFEAEKELGVTLRLIPDMSREKTAIDDGMELVNWAIRNMENGIIALGLGGPEIGYPPKLFESIFRRAKKFDLASVPHAGETEGPKSIWGSLQALHAVRIGHGVRCIEDPELVQYLRDHQIPLEVCPTSNVKLGVAKSFEKHPLPQLIKEGLCITINSDDPPMFGTTLTDEYLNIVDTFQFDIKTLKHIVLNSVQSSLQPIDAKMGMIYNFKQSFIELENKLGISLG
ncbi:MAG: adenosine deaminase [Candidatus Marinimicrobia bacterium]|jgi:adenosine deaminase|nr:adenosine deaminase [Candidatus Neomarinimicrobiota bacterium]MBT3936358.1 adenosine deaminase [Candidatus Neomarinimicrobiota bacterium]MBT3960310.1 adenosine deaminase [Candidatus Neomarinimicrobiota bacterium]MBT4383398.1 adenosine deaminase [Candidatus Neomarinimicrobiota bacterium]MBT4635411.1 adenosine deaminase [Candidatus Neomarinimicrobiota bacterium]